MTVAGFACSWDSVFIGTSAQVGFGLNGVTAGGLPWELDTPPAGIDMQTGLTTGDPMEITDVIASGTHQVDVHFSGTITNAMCDATQFSLSGVPGTGLAFSQPATFIVRVVNAAWTVTTGLPWTTTSSFAAGTPAASGSTS